MIDAMQSSRGVRLRLVLDVVATVAARGGGFIAQAKARPDVETITVTAENRDGLPAEIVSRITSQLG